MTEAAGTPQETLHCHVCGEPLVTGTAGFSTYELACAICQASYHVEGDQATCVLPTFVEHHERPLLVPLAVLRAAGAIRHA